MFRVLLPVDSDEEKALTAAEVVATLPNAATNVEVTILNVAKKIEATDEGSKVRSEEWYDESNFPESALLAKKHLENEGIKVELRREHAEPKTAIVEIANEIDADRIVMAGKKRSPSGKVLFGSVTQSVMLNSNIPVTVDLQ